MKEHTDFFPPAESLGKAETRNILEVALRNMVFDHEDRKRLGKNLRVIIVEHSYSYAYEAYAVFDSEKYGNKATDRKGDHKRWWYFGKIVGSKILEYLVRKSFNF